jgi:hypothetical protein
VIPDNARTLRITAAAGTELAGAYSDGTLSPRQVGGFVPAQKKFTTLSAFILHAAWLDQSCLHCPIFLTAASRRSWVRVSVPMWGAMLSHPLLIEGLVGRYPANYLIRRTPIHRRRNFSCQMMPSRNLMGYYRQFPAAIPRLWARCVRVTHPSAGVIADPLTCMY